MTTFISILRGINVGGHNQIKMDALRQLYAGLGYSGILTYIQSGNIIFCTDSGDTQLLERTIAEKIFQTFGCKVPVLVLTIDELRSALQNNPFISDIKKDRAFIHITFLSEIPEKSLLDQIPTEIYLPDEFCCSGKIIYLYCPNGYGNTKLTNTFLENKLKLTSTTRNLKTVTELLALALKI
ncbi:MAG: DUF1697 domain-containing protein [Bacteroidota bacterium]|nr:DUF1697 domain-containing protein [Bacteroidota bacterium]